MKPKRDFPLAVGILVLTFIVFAQTRSFDFISVDDPQYVTRNDRVRNGLSWDNVHWAFTSMRMANWHPLAWISHMSDVQLFGVDPGWHHLSSALLYDPATGRWTTTESMDTARSDHTATLLPSGRLLVAGGHNNIDGYLSNAELYGWENP